MSPDHDHEPRRPEAEERTAEPETGRQAPDSVDRPEAPEAVRAAKTARRPATDRSARAAQELRRARGVEWVRPTDLLARHGAALAGRGIDFEVELARRTRAPITSGMRGLSERARRLPPLSAFGRSTTQGGPSRPGVGMS